MWSRNRAAVLLIVWGVLFSVPSFVWASGATFGADSTVSPELVRLGRERVPWFVAVLWISGFLKLFVAWVGWLLTRPRQPRTGRFAAFCGAGASALLIGHGLLFVVQGALVRAGVVGVKPDLARLTDWYLFLWGPYFVLGGVAAGAAVLGYPGRAAGGRGVARFARAGAACGALGVLLSLASGL